uniref:EGF-like domain-containing protein n=1 Tax=Panagrolaimus davidi TaxID=227884 RepID=A0A914PH23_9BILA
MCVDGFEWNRKSGSCLDVDECETLSQPCLIGADVWCINLVGSYQCCNKSSSESECLGLEISAVDISTGEGGLHTSATGENGTKKKNQWVIETFGEWRNVSGGRAIIIEGKLASNVTETSTISSTTTGSVTEIIPLTGASFSTIPNIKENGTGVTNNKEKSKSTTFSKNSVSSITEIPEQDKTTISTDLNESSSIRDTQFTTPLTPKSAPEQPKSTNPITKILEDLGIITTKKVTSKPIQLITAGPNSIEALDLNAPNDSSSTSNYFESTTVKNDETSTVQIKTTSTFATKITKSPKAKTTSKKLKIPPKLRKPSTKQPSTTLEITVPETNFTTEATTEISTTSGKTSSKIPKVFKTTPRMVDDTELSRSTYVTQSGENVSAAYLEKLTLKVTESSLATTPHTSTFFVKKTTNKASKPKKRPKTTKKVNVKKTTTGLPKVTTTTPVEPETSSSIPFFTITSEKTTTENEEKFEMEVMVTMRSTTDKSTTTTKSSDITKHTSTVPAQSFPTTKKKGTEKTDYALPTTIPSTPLSTELDIFIPNTPPVSTTKAPLSLNFLNMTLPELNFTISPSDIVSNFDAVTTDKNVSTDVSIFSTTAPLSTLADFDTENESVKTTKFQSSTNAPISNLSVENLFPLPPNIDIESITPEDITAQKFYTFSPQSVDELKDNNIDNMPNSTASITILTEEMFNTERTTLSSFETTTEIEDVSNISTVSRTEESSFTTLPYPKIIFTNNQKSTTESQMIFSMIIPITEATKLVATTTPFTNTESNQNEITSITPAISSQNSVSSKMPNIIGSTTKRYHKVSTDNLTHDNTFLTSTNPPLTTDKTLSSAYTTKRKGMEMIFVDETTLASTKLTTITPIVDLTEIPNDSTSTEVLTSDEKGLEISVITPFKQASSTEIPDSGEMGLEISGKSSTSAEPNETTNIVQSSTAINLPETEIENPESGEHLTQEEIERLRKIEVNRTNITTMLLTTINPSVTQASLTSTTEDLSKVKSGEMGLELSGASTPASAEEFTSEPATAISTTTENEKVSTAKAPDFTTEPEVSISTTKAENSKERSTTESESSIITKTSTPFTSSSTQERTTVSAIASLTLEVSTSAKTTLKTEEGSFEKVPKSGEMGLELSGVSTPSSAEEFTSEPATAISTAIENEKASTKKTADFTTESAVPTSTVEGKSSQEQVTTESETLTSSKAETSTSTDRSITSKSSPKSKEGSFEKIPKSGEVGLEIGGNDLSGSTETTLSPTSQTAVERTTSFSETTLSTSPEKQTSKKAATDSSEETTLSPSLTPETSTAKAEDTTIADNVTLTSASTSPTTDAAEITPAVTNAETSTIGNEKSSTGSPLPEKDTSPFAETTEKTRSSSSATSVVAEESSTASSATDSPAPSTTENISTLASTLTTQTITAITETSTEKTHEATEISATPAISTSAPTTSPVTEQSKISPTPGEEKKSTTGDEIGLELTGKGLTSTPTAPTTEVEEEAFSNTISTDVQETTSAEESSPATNNAQTETVPTPSERLEFTSPVKTEESSTVTISNPSSTEILTTVEQKTTQISVTEQPDFTTEASSAVTHSAFEITTSDRSTISSSTFDVTSRISSTEPATTQGAADSTTSSVQTTENASTETPTFATTESSSTTASSSSKPSSESSTSEITVLSTESSSTTPTSTSEPLTASSASVITENQTVPAKVTTAVPLASSEPPLIQSESTVFEATYATNQFTTVLPSTEISVTDTLPTSETLTPAETTVIYSTTEINEQISTHLTEEATAATPIETVGDFTTIIPSETSHQPPIIIVDQSRSHEEVDENSQLRSISTQQPATDTTEAETSPFTTISKTKCLSNDACENDSYCERRSGVCRCKPGFEGEPPQNPCQDIDECKQNLDDCHSSSRCLNYIGGYHCVCAIGYRKNAIGVCEDVDECAMSNGTICDSHAVCRNLPGAYLCECNAGYTGDGYNCISIEKRHCNQNEWAKSDCGRNHFCLVDGNGKIDCDVCKNGFIMKNGICSDINECEENSKLCHSDAICQNIMGGYQCRCQPGYAGDGHNCQDIDECGLQNSCHPQATCVNTPGSFMCECPEGWTGDGKNACLNPADQKCSQRSEICKNGRNSSACLSLKTGDNFQSTCDQYRMRKHNWRISMSLRCWL